MHSNRPPTSINHDNNNMGTNLKAQMQLVQKPRGPKKLSIMLSRVVLLAWITPPAAPRGLCDLQSTTRDRRPVRILLNSSLPCVNVEVLAQIPLSKLQEAQQLICILIYLFPELFKFRLGGMYLRVWLQYGHNSSELLLV
mmetsp:Transcript_35037/g.63133  ORF Transcript_35037/g.63133 Transcript_35037/m.63133 type:complete len:140 (+) Transcript_35037:219-638(+)